MRKAKTHGKFRALIGIVLLGAVISGVIMLNSSNASYSGLDEPISVTDRRFFVNPTGGYPQENIWGWTTYEAHKTEAAKHQNVVVFYKNSNARYGDYYMTAEMGADFTLYGGVMSTALVHCPSGATVSGPHNAHLFNSPSLAGMYDGQGHYWCTQNGVGVNPLPGPESGKGMPDTHRSTPLFKNQTRTIAGVTYYKIGYNGGERLMQIYTGTSQGYAYCKYGMSGPFINGDANVSYAEEHYHCLTADGGREADDGANSEAIMLGAPPLPVAPTCTLTLNDNKTSYTSDSTTFVNYTYNCSPSTSVTSVAVQVVKPDGTATIYNTTNSTSGVSTSSMGFGTSNLSAGNYTLRICVNDNTCSSPSSFVSVPFAVTTATAAIPAAPTNLTAVYSTENLGQREVVLTVTDNAANETYHQLYWHLSGTAWSSTAPKDTYNSSTWTQPANVGRMQIAAPATSGTYEYKLQACNSAGCSSSNVASVTVPGTAAGTIVPSTDPIGYWKFDGNGANEVVGGPAVAIVGSAEFKSTGGKIGGYAYIPSIGNYFKIPYNSIFDLPDSFTIEFWFRQRANQGANQSLIYKGTAPNNYNFNIFRYLWNQYNNGAVITGFTSSSTGNWTQTSNNNEPPHNVWHHVAFTKNTSGSAYYIDGTPIHSSSQTDAAKTPHNDIIIGDTAVDTDIDNLKIYNRALSAAEVSAIGGFPTTTTTATTATPGTGAPEPTNNEAGVWAQVDIATGQILSSSICTRSVCGINGEYHGYVPPPTYATGSTWWPTSKRYIWQLPGQAGYGTGTFNFNTYIFTVAGGTIYNGVLTPTTTSTTTIPPTTSTTPTATTTPPTASDTITPTIPIATTPTTTTTPTTPIATPISTTTGPKSCANGEKCASGSWCNNGSMCYYPDSQLTCVAWPTPTAGAATPAMSSVSCPSGTSVCNPTDVNCVTPGQTVPYSSSKWCMQSQSSYSNDGKSMTCVKWGESAPSGYSSCRPDDTSCIPEGGYGSSNGWCTNAMKCYQKATDTDPKNDVYCAKTPYNTTASSDSVTCPSGYSVCSPTDTTCKSKGEKWTDANAGYYCMNAQKCTLSSGGGLCVGWNEACPSGTKYCNAGDQYCVEPGEYKALTSGTAGGYWCGGGGGMAFYSSSKAYCEPKKVGAAMADMMWTAADIKAILNKLGAGWGVCRPGDANCIEPGKTGPSTGWCGWMPPVGGYMSPLPGGVSTRNCPSLDEVATPPPTLVIPTETTPTTTVVKPTVPPVPQYRECAAGEIPNAVNNCMASRYHWNIAAKVFEKCTGNEVVTVAQKQRYTSCESMNFDIEKEWRTERYLVHPPEIDGEWYMPPWDAASKMQQYNSETDKLEECSLKGNTSSGTDAVQSYTSICMPIPEIDRGWMLKKFRAEYKMYLMYKNQGGFGTTAGATAQGISEPIQPNFSDFISKPTIQQIQIPQTQCKGYLLGVRQSLNGDKAFWKDLKRQIGNVPQDYPDLEDFNKLLGDSKDIIVAVEKLAKGATCGAQNVADLKEKLDTLHSELFPQLSSYMPDIQDYVEVGQCKNSLKDKQTQLSRLLKDNGLDAELKQEAQDLTAAIDAKLKELSDRSVDFEYDAGFECQQFRDEVESQMASLLRLGDKEINLIIERIVSQKFQPVIAQLTAQYEERGKKIDELLVQVAQLQKTFEGVSKTAAQMSDKIAVSYSAMTQIQDKFAEQKAQIQAAKDKLIPRIQTAVDLLKTRNCVSGADKENLLQALSSAGSVNWIGERADEVDKRITVFVNACSSNDVSSADVNTLSESIKMAASQNLQDSYVRGLTRFSDVSTDTYFYGAMQSSCYTQGKPRENALKQEALLMILRSTGAPESSIIGDCGEEVRASGVRGVSPYATCAVKYALNNGIKLEGAMNEAANRIEVAQWLSELGVVKEKGSEENLKLYTDIKGLDGNARSAVANVVRNGVMVGNVSNGVGEFKPNASLARADLAVILQKLGGAKCSK